MTGPARPDLDAIKRRVVLAGGLVTLAVAERDALVAWVEAQQTAISVLLNLHGDECSVCDSARALQAIADAQAEVAGLRGALQIEADTNVKLGAMNEAAQREVERLTQNLAAADRGNKLVMDQLNAMGERAEQAEREVERLRREFNNHTPTEAYLSVYERAAALEAAAIIDKVGGSVKHCRLCDTAWRSEEAPRHHQSCVLALTRAAPRPSPDQ